MAALHLHRLFYSPRPSVNKFGEPVPPPPCIDSATVRRNPSSSSLEVCMTGRALVGCADGPHLSIDGQAAACVCFEEDTLVAVLPPGLGPRVHILVNYGPIVCGDFVIKTKPGTRVRRWSIRIDERLRSQPGRR